MTVLALDAMGSDHGPAVVVEGAAKVSRLPDGPRVLLVGDRDVLRAKLRETAYDEAKLALHHAPDVVTMDENPREALVTKPRSSVLEAARLVRAGEADALVSAGSTGAVSVACAQTFERLPGVTRCGLGAVFPTERRRDENGTPFSLILDAGLTVEVSADDLIGFAFMGSAYVSRVFRKPRPRVALLSNGAEAHKGPAAIVEANRALSGLECLNFIGNIEGLDIPRGTADVVVTGGFVGNIVIKMLEGVADTVARLGRHAMKESILYKAGLALLSPGIRKLRRATDWEQYGGAPILGFDRLCIKAHGRSSSRAIENALLMAQNAVQTDMVRAIRDGLREAGRS